MSYSPRTAILAAAGMSLLAAAPASAEPQTITLEPAWFDLSAARSVSFESRAGREAICLEGPALIENVEARGGVLSAEILNTGRRAFANLIFHVEDSHTFEAAYLRLHKSGQFDAVQYTPHIAGESHWQLLGGAQLQAAFGQEEWIPFEIAFTGEQARLRVGEDAEMMVADLRLDGDGERVGLNSLFGACYTNVKFNPATPDLGDFDPPAPAAEGSVDAWAISAARPFDAFPDTPQPGPEWTTVAAEPDGFVYFSRYAQRSSSGEFESNPEGIIYAAVRIEADTARRVPLHIDASDKAKIWLNGAALAEFDNSFWRKGRLFRGDVDPTAQTLYLDLQPGENMLVIGVAERANGWGLAAALPDREGLHLSAP